MKIYPVRNLSQNSFQSKLPAPPKLPSKTRQFFEGVSVAAITSIPMFVYMKKSEAAKVLIKIYSRYFLLIIKRPVSS